MKDMIKQNRAQHIIDSAQRVFCEKGYAKTSITDICKLAKCSRTTTYSYFDTKENLYLAVVYKSFSVFLSHFAQVVDIEKSDSLDAILQLSKGYLQFARQSPLEYSLITDFYNLLSHIDRMGQQTESQLLLMKCTYYVKTKEHSDIPLDILMNCISTGQKKGSINNECSAREHMINIWAYLKGITEISSHTTITSPTYERRLETIVLITIEKMLGQ